MRARGLLGFLLSTMLAWACTDPTVLSNNLCEQPCYSGDWRTDGVGLCRPGMPVCVDGVPVSCAGETLPSPELCDGLDNDCDGKVDGRVTDALAGTTCMPDIFPFVLGYYSQCKTGTLQCHDAALVCDGLVLPTEEVCDGKDNDCDGDVDEDLPIVDICYDGDPLTLARPNTACRAGVITCYRGGETCVGQVLPSHEICDRKDNDCDGAVDNVPLSTTPRPVDVALLIDVSCSMADKLPALKIALDEMVRQHTDLYRYAIVLVPGQVDGVAELLINLSTSTTATTAIAALDAGGGSYENSYDAIAESVDGSLGLTWRSEAVHVVVWFGDEDAQSRLRFTEQEVTAYVLNAGALFYAFVESGYVGDYDEIANTSGGQVFHLSAALSVLRDAMRQVIQSGCPP